MKADYDRDMSAAEAKAFGTAFLESFISACKETPPETLMAIEEVLRSSQRPAPQVEKLAPTKIESKAFAHIRDRLSPSESSSVRNVFHALNFKASRSGLVVIIAKERDASKCIFYL